MEKFALLDFLKVFEALSANGNKKNEDSPPLRAEKAPPPQAEETKSEITGTEFNAMASVLSRHEQISNRIKNSRR